MAHFHTQWRLYILNPTENSVYYTEELKRLPLHVAEVLVYLKQLFTKDRPQLAFLSVLFNDAASLQDTANVLQWQHIRNQWRTATNRNYKLFEKKNISLFISVI